VWRTKSGAPTVPHRLSGTGGHNFLLRPRNDLLVLHAFTSDIGHTDAWGIEISLTAVQLRPHEITFIKKHALVRQCKHC
jgi:hypothetical protein